MGGLVQSHHAVHVELHVLSNVLPFDFQNRRVNETAASIGKDNVEMLDAMLFQELRDNAEGILFRSCIVFGGGHDDDATLALGQVGERLRSLVLRPANGGDHSLVTSLVRLLKKPCPSTYMVWQSQEALGNSKSQPAVGSSNQDNGRRHVFFGH